MNGEWDFDCQHGPKECLGNKYQACLLKRLSDKSDLIKLEVIKCIMNDTEPHAATEKVLNLVFENIKVFNLKFLF
jgi:hypothetical protein